MNTLSQEELKAILEYNPETGNFIWSVRKSTRTHIGDVAGCLNDEGYIKIKINKKRYSAHSLAFLYMNGEWPKEQVDHINQIKNDNCWINLRECSQSQNQANCEKQTNNNSGYKGVVWQKDVEKWRCQIGNEGETEYLGVYNCKHEAAHVYNTKAKEYFGEFASINEIEEVEMMRHKI